MHRQSSRIWPKRVGGEGSRRIKLSSDYACRVVVVVVVVVPP